MAKLMRTGFWLLIAMVAIACKLRQGNALLDRDQEAKDHAAAFAKDDPFLPARCIPRQNQLPDNVALEACDGGGHVGFVMGADPRAPRFWLEDRALAHFSPWLT